MTAKIADIQKKESQRVAELVELDNKVHLLGGVWKTVAEVDAGLAAVKQGARGGGKGKMVEALKTQINFRRKVLRQRLDDLKLWNFSENRHVFTVDELSERLKVIIAKLPIPESTNEQSDEVPSTSV